MITSHNARELHNIQMAYRLNGNKYLKFSQLVCTFLKGKGKLSHFLGIGLRRRHARFVAWDKKNSIIMSWLCNLMLPKISDTCMFLKTIKDIWDVVH